MIQDYIDRINDAIVRSLRHESHIDAEILKVKGFSTGVMRRLVNWLTRIPENPIYLELGCYAGGTLCAAMNNNPKLTVVGVENKSQPFGDDSVFERLYANVERFKGGEKSVNLIDGDCFEINLNLIPNGVTCMMYDGEHNYESQAKALPHFLDKLAETFILLVDDFDWSEDVRKPTYDSINALKEAGKIRVEREWTLTDGKPDGENWHNGFAIFLITKISGSTKK